jgi:hypothetical protein
MRCVIAARTAVANWCFGLADRSRDPIPEAVPNPDVAFDIEPHKIIEVSDGMVTALKRRCASAL